MTIRQTSVEAYHRIEAEGLLSRRRWEVYSTLYKRGPLTATGIASNMEGYKSPSVGANVHARLCELREMGCVQEVGEAECPHTGQLVIAWDVTAELPGTLDKQGPTRRELIEALCQLLEGVRPRIVGATEQGRAWLQKSESVLSQCAKHRSTKRRGMQ